MTDMRYSSRRQNVTWKSIYDEGQVEYGDYAFDSVYYHHNAKEVSQIEREERASDEPRKWLVVV